MPPRKGPSRHPLTHADPPDVDWRGIEWCHQCGLPETNPIHELLERDQEERELEARRIGDRQHG